MLARSVTLAGFRRLRNVFRVTHAGALRRDLAAKSSGRRRVRLARLSGPTYAKAVRMNQKAAALCTRIRRFRVELETLCAGVEPSAAAKRMVRRLSSAATAVDISYQAACKVGRAEDFLPHVSAAARHARRARRLLQDFVQMNYVTIVNAREVILEARALEAILVASRNTVRRRRKARQRRVMAGERFAKNPSGADRQP
jgi:hypothetical protein